VPDAPLTPTRHARLQALFEAALAVPAAERAAFLAAAERDASLVAETLALLAAHARDDVTFRSPVSASVLADAATGADRWVGRRVGAYEVTARIGLGGMGAVYAARRADDEYRKTVAIKFLHRHAESEAALRRFRAERQILASLDHPHIATLLDGGVTAEGQPYLVMEHIEGRPLAAWCDERRATVRERLALFLQVCEAVQHAHQQLVVHRDLKPGNILVTADGRVKLLDFGIARLLPADDGDAAEAPTVGAGRSFTPDYAAPEQVRGLPVGTTADVYALGVVLFELLAGRRPFALEGKSLGEIERIVAEEAPPRPSALVDGARAAALGEASAARARGLVAGDLDAIVGVALRKEPARRYGSADLLARDVRAHLAGRPVSARPDGVGYRLGKLVRRRALETAAAVVAVASLVGGLVAARAQAQRAEAQRRRAESQSARAEQVTAFLTSMLGSADPAALGREVTVREALDTAAVRADTLRGDPELEAEVRDAIGSTYMALGAYVPAERQFGLALAAHARRAPGGDFTTAMALSRQAWALEFEGRYAEADSVLGLAARLHERFPYTDSLQAADFLDNRARVLSMLGRLAEADTLLERSLAINLRYAAGRDSLLAYAYTNLGKSKADLGALARADSLYALALAATRRAFGERHPLVGSVLSPYASLLESLGEPARAESMYVAAIALRRELLGPENPEYAWTLANYADFLENAGRHADAARAAREVVALRGTVPETHPAIGTGMQVLGRALGAMDSLAAGERWLREGLAIRRRALPAGHWAIASSESVLAGHLVLMRRYGEAEALLVPAERAMAAVLGPEASSTQKARKRLVALYTATGQEALAAAWRDSLATTP
jgi:serine/threonine-protein kinase